MVYWLAGEAFTCFYDKMARQLLMYRLTKWFEFTHQIKEEN